MALTRKRLVLCILGVVAVYALLVLLCLAINASWKSYLGVAFGRDEALECVYGPAITLTSVALLWGCIWLILRAADRRTRRCS